MPIIPPGLHLQSTFVPKCFRWSTECCCCDYENICFAACCWPVSKLKNSKAFSDLCWQGEPQAPWRPSWHLCAHVGWWGQIIIPRLRKVLSGLISVEKSWVVFFSFFFFPSNLPYLEVFLASTRERSPNTLRHPLYV